MSVNLRLPNITADTEQGQLSQMKSYMYQLVQELNWALEAIESASNGDKSAAVEVEEKNEPLSPEEVENTFNSIKALIIKSADIVHAYETTMKETFDGEYVAISDFGTYQEETNLSIEKNSKGITEVYSNVQNITNPDGTGSLDELNACIKRGLIGYDKNGDEVYGISIGESDENGNFKDYAWFTSDKLSFFDDNGNEVAYISKRRLYITDAIFLGTLQFGGYKIDTSDGIAFTWMGG